VQYGYKKAEFDADFESVENVAKRLMQKSYQRKSDQNMEFLNFYCWGQKIFRPISSFG